MCNLVQFGFSLLFGLLVVFSQSSEHTITENFIFAHYVSRSRLNTPKSKRRTLKHWTTREQEHRDKQLNISVLNIFLSFCFFFSGRIITLASEWATRRRREKKALVGRYDNRRLMQCGKCSISCWKIQERWQDTRRGCSGPVKTCFSSAREWKCVLRVDIEHTGAMTSFNLCFVEAFVWELLVGYFGEHFFFSTALLKQK